MLIPMAFAWTALALLHLAPTVVAASPTTCATDTTQVVVPTTTYTFYSTYYVSVTATTPKDLGTFTDITTIRTTKTLKDVTSTVTDCTATQTFTRVPAVTVYTTAKASGNVVRRDSPEQQEDPACVVTSTSTTTYGGTYTWIPSNETRTYTAYTQFTMATVSKTTTGGTSYTIGTSYTTTCKACGPTVDAPSSATSSTTVTMDARCAPTAITSAAGGAPGTEGYGILYLNEVPYGGASYRTNTTDASTCCQLCVQEAGCAASAWDIRTNQCRLLFSAQWDTGALNCGNGALAFYNYGPVKPMKPGTGWYMGAGCGWVQYANAKPDDGT